MNCTVLALAEIDILFLGEFDFPGHALLMLKEPCHLRRVDSNKHTQRLSKLVFCATVENAPTLHLFSIRITIRAERMGFKSVFLGYCPLLLSLGFSSQGFVDRLGDRSV
jgi:hypothetical protein